MDEERRYCLSCGDEITEVPRAEYCLTCVRDEKIIRKIRGEVNLTVRAKVLKRDKYECFYCGIALTTKTGQVDHKTPVVRGGGSDMSNLIASCFMCNMSKGTKTTEEFLGIGKMPISSQQSYVRSKDWRTWVYGGCKRPQ